MLFVSKLSWMKDIIENICVLAQDNTDFETNITKSLY